MGPVCEVAVKLPWVGTSAIRFTGHRGAADGSAGAGTVQLAALSDAAYRRLVRASIGELWRTDCHDPLLGAARVYARFGVQPPQRNDPPVVNFRSQVWRRLVLRLGSNVNRRVRSTPDVRKSLTG